MRKVTKVNVVRETTPDGGAVHKIEIDGAPTKEVSSSRELYALLDGMYALAHAQEIELEVSETL